MKLLFMSEYIKMELSDICEVGCVDFTNISLKTILLEIKDSFNKELCEAVRKVGNNYISSITVSKFEYTVGCDVLSIANLSTAEFYFLVAEICKLTDYKFVIMDGTRMLSNKTLEVFLKEYSDTNILLVCLDTDEESYYRTLSVGERLGIW